MLSYLRSSPQIDHHTPSLQTKAAALAAGAGGAVEVAERCFLFVRDAIHHSSDHRLGPITCRASDVLAHGTGYCYAKSHLLAALLRANGLPAGLCYQRLALEEGGDTFCLHGFNAVWLDGIGWYRMDARGNTATVATAFTPPQECLAYKATGQGEQTFAEIWAEPLPQVVQALTTHHILEALEQGLPDWVG